MNRPENCWLKEVRIYYVHILPSVNKYILASILIFVVQIAQTQEIWTGIITTTKISQRYSVWNDAHFIPNTFFIYRTGLGIELFPKLQFVGGYSFLLLNQPKTGKLERNEHRPWFQVEFRHNLLKNLQLRLRHRNDIRFIENINSNESNISYTFQNRWRWMISLKYGFYEFNNGMKMNFTAMFENLQTAEFGELKFKTVQNRIFLLPGVDYKRTSISFGFHTRFIYNPIAIDDAQFSGLTCWIVHRFGK